MEKPTHIPTIQELIDLPALELAQISPDGRIVAYQQSQPDWEKNSYIPQIFLVSTDGKIEPQQITFTPNGSHEPRWSPDGRFLAFISKREGDKVSQIYRLATAGGEAERLSEAATNVQQFRWSPDGKSLAFTAVDAETEADKARKKSFGAYKVEDEDFKYSHLWQLTLPDKKLRKLTTGKQFTVSNFDWSPDSRAITFAAPPNTDMGILNQICLYQVEVETLSTSPLTPTGYFAPAYSPDGRYIFCLQFRENYYTPERPCLINLESGNIQPIEIDFGDNLHPLGWFDKGLIFSAAQRTNLHLFLLDPHSGQICQLSPNLTNGWVSHAQIGSVAADGRTAAFIMDNASQLDEIVLLNLENGQWHNLTNLTDTVANWQLSEPEPYQWQSKDGTPIEGTITKPIDFDPQKKYPLLVAIHGGPSWVSLQQKLTRFDLRIYPLPLWAAKGAIILQPNYRGSIGYGSDFQALNVRNLGLGDYDDVISGVDALIAEGWVDGGKVGSMGWSQGGYISMFITTYSDRFKAVSAGAGISNWMTYYVNTDVHPFTRQYLKATPWDEMEIYEKTSPMTYIKNAQTPTLIQHGRNDARVPLPNAYELYQGLRDMDVPVRLVTYPGMPHGPSQPRQSRQIMQDNLDWFNHWIWGEETEADEKRPYYIGYGNNKQIEELCHWAFRDGAICRTLTGAAEATESTNTQKPEADLTMDEAANLVDTLATQLETFKCSKLIFYSAPIEKRPSAQIALGCLHLAAAQAGGIKVEHEEVKDWGSDK